MTSKLRACACSLALGLSAGCAPGAAARLDLRPLPASPRDAAVYIDEQYIGALSYVAARGVRLPAGEHRLSVEKEGYFPFDALIVSDGKPIRFDVQLVQLPE